MIILIKIFLQLKLMKIYDFMKRVYNKIGTDLKTVPDISGLVNMMTDKKKKCHFFCENFLNII